MKDYEYLIGKEIKIINLKDEPEASLQHYRGKTGVVEEVKEDAWGDVQLWGTWGGIAIYPKMDEFEILSE